MPLHCLVLMQWLIASCPYKSVTNISLSQSMLAVWWLHHMPAVWWLRQMPCAKAPWPWVWAMITAALPLLFLAWKEADQSSNSCLQGEHAWGPIWSHFPGHGEHPFEWKSMSWTRLGQAASWALYIDSYCTIFSDCTCLQWKSWQSFMAYTFILFGGILCWWSMALSNPETSILN